MGCISCRNAARFLISVTEVSVDDKFVSDASDIDNADTFVLGKFMP